VNPWRDAGVLSVIKKPGAPHAYTLEDAEAISNALIDNPPAQLVFCLAAFVGLRPDEQRLSAARAIFGIRPTNKLYCSGYYSHQDGILVEHDWDITTAVRLRKDLCQVFGEQD
jgi:hypothetical protein